jgi:AraC-like DNA-binding protein
MKGRFFVFHNIYDKDYQGVYHTHSQLEFTYILSGKGQVTVNNKIYYIHSDMMLIYQPYQMHKLQLYTDGSQEFALSVFHFDPFYVSSKIENFPELNTFFQRIWKYPLLTNTLDLPKSSGPIIRSIVEYCDMISESSPSHDSDFLSGIIFLINHIKILMQNTNILINSERNMSHVETAMEWLNNNIDKKLNLSVLAAKIHITPNHLSNTFKKMTGISLSQYLTEQRIKHASMLLKSTSLSVNEIAYRVGIQNQSSFIRLFKENVGKTPGEFRRL